MVPYGAPRTIKFKNIASVGAWKFYTSPRFSNQAVSRPVSFSLVLSYLVYPKWWRSNIGAVFGEKRTPHRFRSAAHYKLKQPEYMFHRQPTKRSRSQLYCRAWTSKPDVSTRRELTTHFAFDLKHASVV